MSSDSEVDLSLKAVFSALGQVMNGLTDLQAAIERERGGFVGGVNSSLGYTNLVNQDPSNQDPSNPSLQTPSHDPCLGSPGREVFDYWCKVMGKTKRAVYDRKRQRAVSIQLKLGRSVADLKRAVDGCKADPFSMGQNERAQVFNDFCLIFRDAAHVEKFLAIADGVANPQLRSATDPEKLRLAASAERRIQDTRRLLDRQKDPAGRTDPDAAKQRLAELVAKVGKGV